MKSGARSGRLHAEGGARAGLVPEGDRAAVRAGDIEMFEEIQSLPEQGLRPCERVRRRQSVPNVGPVTVAAFVVSCRSR